MVEIPQSELERLCKKYYVKTLWVFGSALRPDFDARSDIDLLAEFDDPVDMSLADQFFNFWEEVANLFGRRVDLVELKAIKNPIFAENVNRSKQLLYAA
jgi:predicted nucleotidyltransferase